MNKTQDYQCSGISLAPELTLSPDDPTRYVLVPTDVPCLITYIRAHQVIGRLIVMLWEAAIPPAGCAIAAFVCYVTMVRFSVLYSTRTVDQINGWMRPIRARKISGTSSCKAYWENYT